LRSDRDGKPLSRLSGRWEEGSVMLAGVLAVTVVVTVVVLAYVTDVLAARERVERWRLDRTDGPRGADEDPREGPEDV
jgi:hypothetical protein